MPLRTSALIVGGGGREHALGIAIADGVDRVYGAPKNIGIANLPNGVKELALTEDQVIAFAIANRPELTIIGPETWLANGTPDKLRAEGLAVFGPSAEAAQLETSKVFACELMDEIGVPHPRTQILHDKSEAAAYKLPGDISTIVIKADGLAAGKGVILPQTKKAARSAISEMINGLSFDGAGAGGVLIQERLTGEEVSAYFVTNGDKMVMLPLARDYKRLGEGDTGPNTGGMGAFAPLDEAMVSAGQRDKIQAIAQDTIKAMKARHIPFQGVLGLDIMLADQYDKDPVVLEYNVRFGDPQAQVLMPILKLAGVDVYDLLRSANNRNLSINSIPQHKLLGWAAVTRCLAVEGYPDSPVTGEKINGLDDDYGWVRIHHGATKRPGSDGRIITAGGRALFLTGVGETVTHAAQRSLTAIGSKGQRGVWFNGMQYRRDIGQ